MKSQLLKLDPMDFGCQRATVVAIHVVAGQTVREGDSLVEFEGEKASFELSMPLDGLVKDVLVSVGEIVHAESNIARIIVKTRIATKVDDISLLTDIAERYPIVSKCPSLKEAVQLLDRSVRVSMATKDDAPLIAKVYVESALTASTVKSPTLNDQTIAWFEGAILNAKKKFWKCEIDYGTGKREVIGHCNIERVERTPEVCYHFIGLYVAAPQLSWTPAFAIVSEVLHHCRSEGIEHLLAITHATNSPALKLLSSTGFREIGLIADLNYLDGQSRFFEMDVL